ncbi:MAG: substrate-binding domain-containing protein [Spirochaetaceae bacterium]|jgi:AI-2 transport system substrate-binding protein|nr:substrate-binding domain-containing protein [Spirochaetaceae bacterium]
MKKTVSFALMALVLAALALPVQVFANGEKEKAAGAGKNITIVFVPKITGNAFFETANDGAQARSKTWGFTVKYDGSPEAAVANQVTVIRNAIRQGANGISVSSLDATALDGVLKEAMATGMAVTTWDSDVSGDARTVMVSQGTPDILGKMLVDMGVKSLQGRGKNPDTDTIRYAWHYSQSTVADQNSWRVAGEAYIKQKYPKWVNVRPDNYYSNQDAELAVSTGEAILKANANIDLIICNDSTALPGQLQAAQTLGYDKSKVTITGFATPNSIKPYARAGILERWGLWDSGLQGALGVYFAYYLASGNQVKVGDKVNVPGIGEVEVLPNTVLDPAAYTAPNSGVVLLPERAEFTTANMDNYNF